MRTIYLLRHAKSSWKDQALEDFDRPLAKRGRLAADALGRYLADQGIVPAQILCSSAVRTRETLMRMQRHWRAAIPTRFEKNLYMADAPTLLRRLRRLNDALTSVMVIGHNPGLESLALMLTGGGDNDGRRRLTEKYPTGALAILTTAIRHWAELGPEAATLQVFVTPRELQALVNADTPL